MGNWTRNEAVRVAIRDSRALEWSATQNYSHSSHIGFWSMVDRNPAPDTLPTDDTWTLANAKARLSELVDRAQTGPQVITRHGKPNAVVVSVEEWARKVARKGTLAEFLLASPLRGADLELDRVHDTPRDEMP